MTLKINFKYCCVLLLNIFLIKNASGQSPNFDKINELKKYSYLIYADQGQYKYSATGFFIRRDNKLFLIGAGHTFNGKNTITKVDDLDYPNKISIIICKECDDETGILHIDISKIKEEAQTSTFTVKPEIYVYEIKDKLRFKVNSIEKLIKSFDADDKKLIDSVFMFGYPRLNGNSTKEYRLISPTASYGNLFEKYNTSNYYAEIETYDKINYLMKPDASSPMGGGFSGAPCFFLLNNKFYFGGVCIGGSINKRLIINVRPEEVLNLMH